MVGSALSRWTMSYFAAALAFLLGAEVLMALGYGFPATPLIAPETLVLVHMVAVGWLSLLMLGALFQFVPVLVARPIHSQALPLPALVSLVAGLVVLLLGFLQLAGRAGLQLPLLPAGACLIGIGFALALWNLGRTILSARPLPLPARFVAVGLACAAATVALGTVFAFVLSGQTAVPHLLDIAANGVPLHAVAGIAGWLTFTAMGVSYRLLAMFMLAPENDGARPRAVLYGGTASLALAILGGTAAICAASSVTAILVVAGLLGFCALALYGGDVLHLYHARKRRSLELNARMAAVALMNLGAVVLLSIALLAAGQFESQIGAIVFLASFGWLTGLGLAKLYKIVSFLTWLECYGPVLGRTPTPRVQDLVVERRAAKWFWSYYATVWGGTASLLASSPAGFRAAAALMFVATTAIVIELLRTRFLTNVQSELRRLHGMSQPRLFTSHAPPIR